MWGFTYICVDLASLLVSRLVVYAAMSAVCCLLLLTHWVVTDCPTFATSALYCAATVRLVAVSYKLHWSYVLLADNLHLRRVGGCVRLTRARNHARSIRVTLGTNKRSDHILKLFENVIFIPLACLEQRLLHQPNQIRQLSKNELYLNTLGWLLQP